MNRTTPLRLSVALAILGALTCRAALAEATVRIEQADGTVNTYRDSIVSLRGDTVRVFSPDRHDTLVVAHGACSYIGEIERCLADHVTLHRKGGDHAIAFERGTVYLNPGDSPQSLPHGGMQVPPGGLELFVRTARGTLIAVDGTIQTGAR